MMGRILKYIRNNQKLIQTVLGGSTWTYGKRSNFGKEKAFIRPDGVANIGVGFDWSWHLVCTLPHWEDPLKYLMIDQGMVGFLVLLLGRFWVPYCEIKNRFSSALE